MDVVLSSATTEDTTALWTWRYHAAASAVAIICSTSMPQASQAPAQLSKDDQNDLRSFFWAEGRATC
jgi:hypothetical protein